MPLDDLKDHLRTSVADPDSDQSSPSSNPSESESSFERQDENVANVQSLAPINHSDSDPDEVNSDMEALAKHIVGPLANLVSLHQE